MAEPEVKKSVAGRMAFVIIVLVLGATVVLPRFRGPARQTAQGTITQVDPAAKHVSLEYIEPANGATREVSGEVSATCKITVNGAAATLAQLQKGDTVWAQGLVERHKESGKRTTHIVVEEIRVTRGGGNAS